MEIVLINAGRRSIKVNRSNFDGMFSFNINKCVKISFKKRTRVLAIFYAFSLYSSPLIELLYLY